MATAAGGDGSLVLPPSPNWFCSQICDWGWTAGDGALAAFGAKNDVYVYQVLPTTPRLAFKAQIARGKKAQRVTAVRFLHAEATGDGAARIVSGSEGGHIQIWDVRTGGILEQHKKHSVEITAVATAAAGAKSPSLVVAGDRQGKISCWDRAGGRVGVLSPVSGDGVFSLAMSPRDASLVAVGYRSGLLCLVDALQEILLHRIDAHDQELQCLVWTLTPDESVYLASSSRDKTIKIWRAAGWDATQENESTDGHSNSSTTKIALERILKLPMGKQGQAYNPSKHLWLPVAWSTAKSEPTTTVRLWSGSFDGNLLQWDIPLKGSKQVKPVAIKNGHNRILFNIIALPRSITQQFEAAANTPTLMTVSLDRELRVWAETPLGSTPKTTNGNMHTIAKLLGLGGHVYDVSYSKQLSTIALACGDQTIRLWKLDVKGGNKYNTELLWKGLKSKITSIAWHPSTAGLLAFGTEDGTLGVYDTQSKKQTRFISSHAGEVQQVAWHIIYSASAQDGSATANGDEINSFVEAMHELEKAQEEGASLDDALAKLNAQPQQLSNPNGSSTRIVLWSRDASGQLFESDPDNPDTPSHVVKNTRSCLSFSWSDDESAVAIAKPNGIVEFVDQFSVNADEASNVGVVQDHEDRVCCISWTQVGNSRLIATGGRDGRILVYQLDGDDVSSPILVAKLDGHAGMVNQLKWQPVESDKENGAKIVGETPLLASCGADGCATVWDISRREEPRVAAFRKHVGRVLTLAWTSPTVIVSGGEDQSARIWKIHDFPDTGTIDEDLSIKPRQMKNGAQQPSLSTKPTNPESNNVMKSSAGHNHSPPLIEKASISSAPKKPKKKKNSQKSAALFHSESSPTEHNQVADFFADRSAKLNSTADVGVCPAGVHIESAGGVDDLVSILPLLDRPKGNLLKSRSAISQFFHKEQTRFASDENWEAQAHVLLLQGKIADALHIVVKEGTLDATWVALSPMAGMEVWHEVTNLFAQQLVAQGDFATAAFHFLSIGKVRSAIRSLLEGAAFPEALALAKQRLGASDPLVREVAWKYAMWLEARGQYGDAALVYSSLEESPLDPMSGLSTSVEETFSWRAGAVRALVKTKNAACIAQAVGLLHELAHSTIDNRVGEGPLSFPAAFITIDILGPLVREALFKDAASAVDLLVVQSPKIRIHSSRPMAATSFCLTRCLTAILESLIKCGSGDNFSIDRSELPSELKVQQQRFPDNELIQLLVEMVGSRSNEGGAYPSSLLSAGHPRLSACETAESLISLADGFWNKVVCVCHQCGVWPSGDESNMDEGILAEAQDLLMDDENSWLLLEWRKQMLLGAAPSVRQLFDAAIDILRFVVDAMAGCLISSMEHLVRLLDDVVDTIALEELQGGDEEGDSERISLAAKLIVLLFPGGVASSSSPVLDIGELGDEPTDAQSLWQTLQLLQCRVAVGIASRQRQFSYEWVDCTSKRVLDAAQLSNISQESDVAENATLHRERLAAELEILQQLIGGQATARDNVIDQ